MERTEVEMNNPNKIRQKIVDVFQKCDNFGHCTIQGINIQNIT